jgi:hypothetical protein
MILLAQHGSTWRMFQHTQLNIWLLLVGVLVDKVVAVVLVAVVQVDIERVCQAQLQVVDLQLKPHLLLLH